MPRLHSNSARTLIVALTAIALITPVRPLAAAGPAPKPQARKPATPVMLPTHDVELQADGTLHGYYVDEEQGAGRSGVKLSLHQNSKQPLATTTTGENGEFRFEGLRGGTYQIVADDEHVMAYRAWAAGTAPPRTSQHVLFAAGDATRAGLWFAGLSPEAQLAIIALIAAGIAIPIAIAASDDDRRRKSENGMAQ